MVLSHAGDIVQRCWLNLPSLFTRVELDAFAVMPNHLHGLIILRRGEASDDSDASPLPNGTQPGSLGAIIQNFKSVSTRRVNQRNQVSRIPLWQRNYYEHIVRNEEELKAIHEYIVSNPSRWNEDENNPAVMSP